MLVGMFLPALVTLRIPPATLIETVFLVGVMLIAGDIIGTVFGAHLVGDIEVPSFLLRPDDKYG